MTDRTARPQPRHAPSHGTRSETPPARAASSPAPRRPAPRGGPHAPAHAPESRTTARGGADVARRDAPPATGRL